MGIWGRVRGGSAERRIGLRGPGKGGTILGFGGGRRARSPAEEKGRGTTSWEIPLGNYRFRSLWDKQIPAIFVWISK